jgi:hypothetical protein
LTMRIARSEGLDSTLSSYSLHNALYRGRVERERENEYGHTELRYAEKKRVANERARETHTHTHTHTEGAYKSWASRVRTILAAKLGA